MHRPPKTLKVPYLGLNPPLRMCSCVQRNWSNWWQRSNRPRVQSETKQPGVKEGEELNNIIIFITNFMCVSLALLEQMDQCLERAQRWLTTKPKDSDSPKVRYCQVFWLQNKRQDTSTCLEKTRGDTQRSEYLFCQDYTVEVQRKHKQTQEVINQLKKKKVKTQLPFLAQLKIHLDSVTKTFPSRCGTHP